MGGRDATMVLLDENGIRCDGRKIDEPRRIMIKAGGLKNADGSAYIEFGDNKILVGVLVQETFTQNTCLTLTLEF
jgi:exosome complex component RRP41